MDCRSQCQGTPCLCIKADPVSATWTDPALPNHGQYPNQGQYPGQGSQYPGQGNQGVQYPGQGVQYEGVDGQQHTYYPVSSRGGGGERVEARLPTYSTQWEANERLVAANLSIFTMPQCSVTTVTQDRFYSIDGTDDEIMQLYKSCNKRTENATIQCNYFHMFDRTHVPTRPCPSFQDNISTSILSRRSPRIVNQASTTLRQCWPNPFSAEREGCSLQYYHSALYNICRCVPLNIKFHNKCFSTQPNSCSGSLQ